MSTVTMPSPCVSSTTHERAPASVSTRTVPSRSPRARATWTATQRTPLPHISGTEPSALRTRMRTSQSAFRGGRTRSTPSAPTPKRRSQRATARSGENGALVARLDDDEVVAQPLVLEKLHVAPPGDLALEASTRDRGIVPC